MEEVDKFKSKIITPQGCLVCGNAFGRQHIGCLMLALEARNLAKQTRSQPYWKANMMRR